MTALVLSSDLLDNGLNALALANKIVICSTEPTSYATAISTSPLHLLGQSTYAIGDVFNPIGNTQSGRSITSINVSSATVAASGTPVCVAFLDDANSRLLAYGPIAPVAGSTSVTAAATWAVDSYEIMMPGMQYPWPNITSTGGVPSVDLNFVAGRYYGSTMSSTINRSNTLFHFDGADGSTVFTDATGRHAAVAEKWSAKTGYSTSQVWHIKSTCRWWLYSL